MRGVPTEASEGTDAVFCPFCSGSGSPVPRMALLTASLIAKRASLSSEKRTSCFVGCTLTSTRRGSTSPESATGG